MIKYYTFLSLKYRILLYIYHFAEGGYISGIICRVQSICGWTVTHLCIHCHCTIDCSPKMWTILLKNGYDSYSAPSNLLKDEKQDLKLKLVHFKYFEYTEFRATSRVKTVKILWDCTIYSRKYTS